MFYKSNFFPEYTQDVKSDFFEDFLEKSYDAIRNGASQALMQIVKFPDEYDFRNAKPVRISSLVKREFVKMLSLNEGLRKKISRFKSHGVDYFLVEGKFLVCLKKIDKKGRVSSFYSKRFKTILNGEDKVPYSKEMLEQLAELGIFKPLPIVFIGPTLDSTGLVCEDVKCVNYKDGGINFLISLKDIFTPNLFNQNISFSEENKADDWSPKLKGNKSAEK